MVEKKRNKGVAGLVGSVVLLLLLLNDLLGGVSNDYVMGFSVICALTAGWARFTFRDAGAVFWRLVFAGILGVSLLGVAVLLCGIAWGGYLFPGGLGAILGTMLVDIVTKGGVDFRDEPRDGAVSRGAGDPRDGQ